MILGADRWVGEWTICKLGRYDAEAVDVNGWMDGWDVCNVCCMRRMGWRVGFAVGVRGKGLLLCCCCCCCCCCCSSSLRLYKRDRVCRDPLSPVLLSPLFDFV